MPAVPDNVLPPRLGEKAPNLNFMCNVAMLARTEKDPEDIKARRNRSYNNRMRRVETLSGDIILTNSTYNNYKQKYKILNAPKKNGKSDKNKNAEDRKTWELAFTKWLGERVLAREVREARRRELLHQSECRPKFSASKTAQEIE